MSRPSAIVRDQRRRAHLLHVMAEVLRDAHAAGDQRVGVSVALLEDAYRLLLALPAPPAD